MSAQQRIERLQASMEAKQAKTWDRIFTIVNKLEANPKAKAPAKAKAKAKAKTKESKRKRKADDAPAPAPEPVPAPAPEPEFERPKMPIDDARKLLSVPINADRRELTRFYKIARRTTPDQAQKEQLDIAYNTLSPLHA